MTNEKLCECGCKESITPRRCHKYGGGGRFIPGHQVRVWNKEGRPPRLGTGYQPRPEEIPSGLCECGCRGKTNTVTKHPNRKRRHFKGHPMPFISGHTSVKGGDEHHLWKGGRIRNRGHILILQPEHPRADIKGYVPEHRLVMEKTLGRFLSPNETVHHMNGIKDDNNPKNLRLVTKREHALIHDKAGAMRKSVAEKRREAGRKGAEARWAK